MNNPKVIISHPRRQHSHQTALALQDAGMLERYFAAIWFKPERLPYNLFKYMPDWARKVMMRYAGKRYYAPINPALVTQLPLAEIMPQLARLFMRHRYHDLIDWSNRIFDDIVSSKIRSMVFDVFIGYEVASLKSFIQCKNAGKIRILDHAAEHYKFQHMMDEKAGINFYSNDQRQRIKIEKIKEDELALADYLITPSRYSKKTFVDAGVPEEKLVRLPYGVDADIFKPKLSYKRSSKLKILYTGIITKRKGIQYLLKAVKELEGCDIELTLVGAIGDAKDVLKKYEGMYTHIPFASNAKLVEYYHSADIFILPSLLDSFGMVVLEAMACGTPVIISENTGAKDVARDGSDGFIIPVMDSDAIKEKIMFFYDNRESVERMGRNASAQARLYPWSLYRKRVADTIFSICNKEPIKREW